MAKHRLRPKGDSMSQHEADDWSDEDEVEDSGYSRFKEEQKRVENLTDEQLDAEIAQLDKEIKELEAILAVANNGQARFDKDEAEPVGGAGELAGQQQSAEEATTSDSKPLPVGNTQSVPGSDIPSSFRESPRCQHIKSNNQQCGSPALKRKRYCYFHDESRSRNKKQIRVPVLEDQRAIQMAITKVCQGITDQTIDAKRGSTLLYGLQVASTAVPKMVAPKNKR